MKKQNIQIVDNFFPNPGSIRDELLLGNFLNNSNSPFSCLKSSVSKSLTQKVLSQSSKYLSNEILKGFIDCEASIYSKMDEKRNFDNGIWIHSDRCSCIGIIFLNPEFPILESGLAFYEHKETGVNNWNQISTEPEIQKMLASDSANLKDWQELYYVENRFNRLVFFDSTFFHQAKGYFGTELQNSRLTINVYFN